MLRLEEYGTATFNTQQVCIIFESSKLQPERYLLENTSYLTFFNKHHPILGFDFSNECSTLNLTSFVGAKTIRLQGYGQQKLKKLSSAKTKNGC